MRYGLFNDSICVVLKNRCIGIWKCQFVGFVNFFKMYVLHFSLNLPRKCKATGKKASFTSVLYREKKVWKCRKYMSGERTKLTMKIWQYYYIRKSLYISFFLNLDVKVLMWILPAIKFHCLSRTRSRIYQICWCRTEQWNIFST